MASIRARENSDGTCNYAVLWRENGKQRSRTFDDEKIAAMFKAALELDGEQAALQSLARSVTAQTSNAGHTLDTWMEHYITHLTGVHEGTRTDYRRVYTRAWKRPLGKLPLNEVRRDKVAAAQNKLVERGYKRKTIANARGLLSAAMDEAVLEELADRNPCRGLKLPRTSHESDEMVFLAPTEWERLYNAVDAHYRPLVRFLIGTGARWGEATALQVGDVDTKTGDVRIVRAWKRVPGELVLGPPKTQRSRRTVRMPTEVVADLKPLLRGRSKDEFLFTTPRGGVVHIAPFWRSVWVPAREAAKLDRAPRVHDLRHTHACWLISAGIPLTVVQRRLGHESIVTTSDTYGHLLPDVIDASATAAGAVFGRLESEAKELPPPHVIGWSDGAIPDDVAELVDGENIDEDDD